MLLLLSTLLGCSSQTQSSSSAGNANPPADGVQSTAPADKSVTLNIAAAASLTDALSEIGAEYNKTCSDVLQFNFAGSGTLQKQISEGAPCDLFISASKKYMDAIEEEGLIDPDSRRNLLSNELTLIAAAEKKDTVTLESLTDPAVESIALGDPESVPAGKYAQQALTQLGMWDQLQDKIIYAKDVRQVLEYVDSGNADCGFVYSSDALMLESGAIIGDAPSDSHDPIVYPAALLPSENSEAAAAFYAFISSDYAKETFLKYGFQVIE